MIDMVDKMSNGVAVITLKHIKYNIEKAREKDGSIDVFGCDRKALDIAIKTLEQQPCEDCISRADTLDAIETWDKFGVNAEQKLIRWQDHYVPYVHLDDVRNAIANMPPVTPKQKIGRWIKWWEIIKFDGFEERLSHYKCSECEQEFFPHPDNFINYCSNCGAKMEVDK